MSTDDFQTKYASVMESMLKSAIAETNELFETMVDELKAEISRIKKENEELRARCSQFEERQSTVYSRENRAPPQTSSEKRDTAVQCDLVPLRTMLVEQCQSLGYSSLQIEQQQCCHCGMEKRLQDHNYGNANSQMTFMLITEEESHDNSSLLPVIKQEDVEPKVSNAGSTGEMFENDEEARVTLELRCHGMDNDLPGAQSQPSEPEHPLVITIKCDTGDKTEGQLVKSEEQTFATAQQQLMVELEKEQLSVVPLQCHREVEMSISEQTDTAVQQSADVQCTEEPLPEPTTENTGIACEELKNGLAESDSNTQPVRRRRGRPPKKVKHLQQPVKETDATTEQDVLNSPSVRVEEVAVSSAIDKVNTTESASPVSPALQRTMESAVGDMENSEFGSLPFSVESMTRERTSGSQQCSMEMEASPTENSSATETLNSRPVESPQASSVTLRERCSSVTLQDALLLVEAMNLSTGGNPVSSFKRMIESPQTQVVPHMDTLQTMEKIPTVPQTLSSKTCDAVGSVAITELSTTQSSVQTLSTSPPVKDSTSTNKAKPHIQHITEKHSVTPSNIATQQMPSSTCATQTSVHSQQGFPRPVIRWITPSKSSNDKPNKIIVVPRPESLSMPYKFAALSPKTVAAQKNGLLSSSTDRPSFSSLPQQTIYAASRKSLPVVPSQSTATSTDQHSGFLPHLKTIIIQRQVSVVASGTRQSQNVLTAMQKSAEPADAVTVSSPQLISLSQESTYSVVGKTAVSTVSPQKKDNNSSNLGSPKQTARVFETTNVPKITCSVSQLEQKLSAVVRLIRLPMSVSTKESVSVSRLLSNGFPESRSVLNEGATQGRLPVDILRQPSKICPRLKDTAVSMSFNTSQMSKEKNNIQDMHNSEYVPPTPFKVSVPVLDISTEAISNAMQGCAPSDNAPIAEKGSVNPIQLISISSKDKSDRHLQMTKTQFLAQLAVSPVVQAPREASSKHVADTGASSAESSTSGRKSTTMARLRSRISTHLHSRRTKLKPEICTETETTAMSPKKLRSHNDNPNNTNTTTEHIPVEPKKSCVVEDIAPKRIVSVPTRRSKLSSETTPKSGRRSSSGIASVASKTVECSSVTPRRLSSTKDGANPKQTKSSVCLKNTKPTSERNSSTRDDAILKQTKSSSVSPKRSCSTREQSSLKKAEASAVTPRKSSLSENAAKFKMSTSEMINDSHRSDFTQHSSSTRQIKRESSPFSLWRKTTASDIARPNSQSGSSYVCWPKLAKDGVSCGKTAETTPAKKPRLIQEVPGPEKNLRVLNEKATTLAKMTNSNQSTLQNDAKTSQLTDKRYKTQAVWIPPTIPASRTSAGGKASLLPLKKETRSSRPQNHIAIYQPSVSLNPISTKAPSMVSPLQPLSVIGGRLLKNQCGECGRILSSSAALESHVRLHKGRRPFSCTLCGKSFPDPKGLKRHGRVHRNGRIHICQECGKGFVYRFGLTKHLQMVHSRIKPFVCQICNKGFFTKRDVEAHIRIHTGEKPFQCNLCEKRFTRRVELNVHLRWHNGEKRHWCSYCGKGFLDFNNLKRHKYIHTGEKPHSCPHCPKHFTQSGHLKKHVKNVHKIH
ncbi:uncharacterized protein [Paralichthys olivaceus]|uniref:uncharacterized protein isoform X2 n=1 Tax=Paralichthys olivaceus TaxID=8255 RepID=UPI003751F0DB